MGTMGILVDGEVFRGIRHKRTGRENIALYNKAAAKQGMSLVYMSLGHIRPPSGKVMACRWKKGKYTYGKLAIPSVIHNRSMPFSKSARKRLSWLNKTRFVFNAKTRYSKYDIHNMLRERFAAHLPATVRYAKHRLPGMMAKYDGLFLKPESGSVGEGILQMKKLPAGTWRLIRQGKRYTGSTQKIRSLVHRIIGRKRYLIQQAIPLARYNNKPYDIRVTVQRGADGDWQLVGMFGKVARKGSGITNVARGGTVRRTDDLFRHSFPYPSLVSANVRQLSLAMARHLGTKLKRLADVGLDMGVDDSGKVYLIEMNARDQRYGFKLAGMRQAYRSTYENPILYGKFVMRSRQP